MAIPYPRRTCSAGSCNNYGGRDERQNAWWEQVSKVPGQLFHDNERRATRGKNIYPIIEENQKEKRISYQTEDRADFFMPFTN